MLTFLLVENAAKNQIKKIYKWGENLESHILKSEDLVNLHDQ